MKVEHRIGDVLTAPAFGHGCNCKGAMGAGVAALVRDRFPDAHADYVRLCRIVRHALGKCEQLEIPELAVPWIGCGIGGLSREVALPAFERACASSSVRLVVFDLEGS